MVLIGRLTADVLEDLKRKLANDNEEVPVLLSTPETGIGVSKRASSGAASSDCAPDRNCDCGAVEVIRRTRPTT